MVSLGLPFDLFMPESCVCVFVSIKIPLAIGVFPGHCFYRPYIGIANRDSSFDKYCKS